MTVPKSLKRNLKSFHSPASELVEVVDEKDRPIAVMPLQEVHKQCLRHRSVMVLLYNLQGKIFLQKRGQAKALYPGRWDISASGHVQAGESCEDAALRELQEELGIQLDSLKLKQRVGAGPNTGWEFVSLYSAGKINQHPAPAPLELAGGYFVDEQELESLVVNFRDLLTPGLAYFWENGLIFPFRTF
ncbi:NUDIX hydrolase [Desulfocurvibacter africanus]|uniref:NUDIX hydrolase n=1 Tax=Desulfocurvibacter africanus TaxID=873 RepID=UPI000412C70C|nr:NUDIX domain-containing protein [Desulfocurvibacter africanus]